MLKTNGHFIDEVVKNEVVSELATQLKNNYVFPEVAEAIEQRLLNKIEAGAYDSFNDVDEFANELTEDLQAVS